MDKELFDKQKQQKMREFFLRELKDIGVIKYYEKNNLITSPTSDYIAVVVDGKIKQTLISAKGISKSLYILQPGEIIGELDYFGGGDIHGSSIAMTNTCISVINKQNLEKALKNNPDIYRYLLYSSSRKFRIVMLQMESMAFNDSLGALAKQILRLSSQEGVKRDKDEIIDMPLTHQELAELMGCSRVTVTRGINTFKNKGIIDIENKMIVIKDKDRLVDYVLG
ncbi:Crp/Fnr family transcriptional regulator [Clostridium sp. D2Q-11]|uniref:Crp/Fnr family transcriptional regulator n=1 Tax=Anaeromonas frigoriresistens TaxID=2683708 RepID=A0A942UXS6_9FIRM|nr:Crp/Fnr family transcriptional regulator [Anaeromonas frigoriresistens]MBS4538291.1 Crp/Fnr family transcriptional regulator [Anaeromonas frigoriresistens]